VEASCAPPLVASRPTEKFELRSLELDVGGAARQGIELVCRKSSGPFFRRLKERKRPAGSCLVGGGARTDPCLASIPVLVLGTSIFLLSRRLLEVTKAGATTSPNPDFMLGVRLSLCSPQSLVVLWLALQEAECPLLGPIWPEGTGRELLLLGVRRNLEGESVCVWLRSLLLLMLVSVSAW